LGLKNFQALSFFKLIMIDFDKLKEIILNNNSFLITTHVNPDADAIGSEVTFYQILKKLGKKAFIVNHSETPYNLEFFNEQKIINKFDENIHKYLFDEVDVLVALDFNRVNRIVNMEKLFRDSKKLKIGIDHHQDGEDFVDYSFIDPDSCATGQILYDFIHETEIVKVDYELAMPIYAAIMTDTGSFRFERTTADVHRIIAELLNAGVNPEEVYDKIYDQSKFSKVRLLGKALESIKLKVDGKLGYMILTQKDFKECNAVESDTENFVNYNLSIENVVVGILFIELKNGYKVSFRSKGNIQVNKLAAEFGGGGHINAAGARFFDTDMQKMIPVILSKAEKYLNN
jgi:phosphoesterase RecJ-like protein